MNESGEIMVTTITPEVALAPVQDAQPDLLSPVKNVDAPLATDALDDKANNKEPETKETTKEVEQVREELEDLTEKKPQNADDESSETPEQQDQTKDQESETLQSTAEKNAIAPKEKEPRIVVDTAAQIRRSLALTFKIVLQAIFQPNETFSGRKLGLADDPARDPKNKAINERLEYAGQSWDAARKAIETIEEESSFGKFLGRVLAESDKVITYKVEDSKKEKKAKKASRQSGKALMKPAKSRRG